MQERQRALRLLLIDLGQRIADMQDDIVADADILDEGERRCLQHAVETDLRHIVGQKLDDARGYGETQLPLPSCKHGAARQKSLAERKAAVIRRKPAREQGFDPHFSKLQTRRPARGWRS